MKVILHIGMPKAGSTALQAAFAKTRRQLRSKGILYPKGAFNHNFLIAGIVPPERIGRLFAQHYDGDAETLRSDFVDFRRGIMSEIEQYKPSVVVLSAESLFVGLGEAGPQPLQAILSPLAAQTEVVCYIRRPSEYYLSMTQQRLKASWAIGPIGAVAYRRSIEAAVAAADRVHVFPYDRSLFPKGDIVAHFASFFVPEVAADLDVVANRNLKPSMSAEAMDIVQAFRRNQHPDENARFTRDTGLLRRRLAEREVELGGPRRPQLLPRVRELSDQSSVDLSWLRDTFGVIFEGIDYEAITATADFYPQAVSDICAVDPERRALLIDVVGSDLTAPIDDTKKKRFRSVFNPRRRSRWRALRILVWNTLKDWFGRAGK